MTKEATAAASSGDEKVYLWWILTADCLSSQTSFLWKSKGHVRRNDHLLCVQFLIFFPFIIGKYWRWDPVPEKSLLGLFQHSSSLNYQIHQLSQRGFITVDFENIT